MATTTPTPSGLFGDNPIERMDQDVLGRHPFAKELIRLMNEGALDMPLTLGVFGEWGGGKTSFINMLHGGLDPQHLVVKFEAWPYANDAEALRRALFLAIIEEIQRRIVQPSDQASGDIFSSVSQEKRDELNKKLDDLADCVYRDLEYKERGATQLNYPAALSFAARWGARALDAVLLPGMGVVGEAMLKAAQEESGRGTDGKDLAQMFRAQEITQFRNQIKSLEQFRKSLEELLKTLASEFNLRLFVFMDDLDRCDPAVAVHALETIKTFLNLPHTVFILAMDRALIEMGVNLKYKDYDQKIARSYLDKIIQVAVDLTAPTAESMNEFADNWWAKYLKPRISNVPVACKSILIAASPPNPRKLKRCLNHFLLRTLLLGRVAAEKQLVCLARLVALQLFFPELFQQAVESPTLLKSWENNQNLRGELFNQHAPDDKKRLGHLFNTENGSFSDLGDPVLTDLIRGMTNSPVQPG